MSNGVVLDVSVAAANVLDKLTLTASVKNERKPRSRVSAGCCAMRFTVSEWRSVMVIYMYIFSGGLEAHSSRTECMVDAFAEYTIVRGSSGQLGRRRMWRRIDRYE